MMPAANGHVGVEANKENTIDDNCNGGCGDEEEDQELSVPRGGPIFVGNFVGPITSVSDFKKNIVEEVQGLEEELAALDLEEEDISVDDLKILTDEELVDMAIKEAFEDDNEDAPSTDNIVCEKKKSNKRKRNKGKQNEGSDYMARVENVRRMKAKQDEEKAAVTLHSFNPNDTENVTSSKSTIDGRMKLLRSANSAVKIKPSSISQGYVPVQYTEVALSIEVYHNTRKWVKNQEFLVLGQQTLTELRDRIYCLTDHVMRKAGQHDPSGYFLIEDTFCNDLRDQSAVDYSEPILDWLENSRDDALKKWECIAAGGELSKKKKRSSRQCMARLRITNIQSP